MIGFLGSLVPYEGLEDLIEATAGLVRQGLDAALLLVGDGDAAPAARARAQELGLADRLVMVGRVPADQVPLYYGLIDVAAFPRLPFKVCEIVPPLKPFEAMAMAKPVVVSDLPALREVVEDGAKGLIVPPGSPAALAEALSALAADPARAARLGAAARQRVVEQSSWSAVAARVGAGYEELTRSGGSLDSADSTASPRAA